MVAREEEASSPLASDGLGAGDIPFCTNPWYSDAALEEDASALGLLSSATLDSSLPVLRSRLLPELLLPFLRGCPFVMTQPRVGHCVAVLAGGLNDGVDIDIVGSSSNNPFSLSSRIARASDRGTGAGMVSGSKGQTRILSAVGGQETNHPGT